MTDEPNPAQVLLDQARFVRSLARDLLGDEHLSEDVVQETSIAALKHAPSGVVNARAWLATVARNFARRMQRARVRREQRERDAARPEAMMAQETGSASATPGHESVLRAVTDAVLALEEPYRSTILLRYFEGLNALEIAARHDVAVATVRSRLQRALAKLRERLDREHGGDRGAWSVALIALTRNGSTPIAPGSTSPAAAAPIVALMTGKVNLAAFALVAVTGWLAWKQPWGAKTARLAAPRDTALAAALDGSRSGDSVAIVNASAPDDATRSVAAVAPIEPYGSIAVHVVYAENGRPAENSHLRLMVWGGPEPFLNSIDGVTDTSGDFRCEHVHAGSVGVYEHHGAGGSVDVLPGLESKCTVSIPRGFTVSGLVVDTDGNPVSNASLWISNFVNSTIWTEIARSNRDGSFRLEAMSVGHDLGARDSRLGPSFSYTLRGTTGGTCDLRIVLGGEGGRIQGRVVDVSGAPIAAARVRIEDGGANRDVHGLDINPGAPIVELRSDSDGRFALDGVAPCLCEVVVRAPSFGSGVKRAMVERGTTAAFDLTLPVGVHVHGVARTSEGTPVAGAWVMVGDYYGDFLSPGTNTASDGSYELTSVDASEIRARASSRANGKDSAKLSLANGRIIEWNPVLTFGSRLLVRVIDERGEPLVDWYVEASATAMEGSPDFHASSATGSDGRCAINNCPARPMRVEVIDIKHFAMPQLVLENVRVTGDEQVLQVRDESRLTSKFSGTLVDADDHPVKARVVVTSLRRRRGLECTSDERTGKFESGPFTADTYLVNATDDQGVNHRVGSYALPSNHDLDLGRIVLERPGRLQIAIRHVASIDVEGMRVTVRTDDPEGMHFGSDWDANGLPGTIPVAAGSYFIDLMGSAIADASSKVVARAGETTRVEFDPIPGVFCSYRIEPEPNAALIAKAHLEFVDAHGVVVHSTDTNGEGRTELRGGYGLAMGDYILRVTTDDGRHGEGQLRAGVGFMHGEALIRVR